MTAEENKDIQREKKKKKRVLEAWEFVFEFGPCDHILDQFGQGLCDL